MKLFLIPVDLACILIIENTNLLTEHSHSLLDFSDLTVLPKLLMEVSEIRRH